MNAVQPTYQRNGTNLLNDCALSLLLLKELRVAEMSGYDYIFAPAWLCEEIGSLSAMQDFMINAQAVFASEPSRTILIQFDSESENEMILDRYNLDWAGELLLTCEKARVNNTPQYDFIKMLFEHSDLLIN